jgi:hypothetical protein
MSPRRVLILTCQNIHAPLPITQGKGYMKMNKTPPRPSEGLVTRKKKTNLICHAYRGHLPVAYRVLL